MTLIFVSVLQAYCILAGSLVSEGGNASEFLNIYASAVMVTTTYTDQA